MTEVLGPKSKKQEMILTNKAKVLFSGGAAGSGKSYLLLLMVLQFVDCPHWRGVIFRRTQPELRDPGGLFDEAMSLYMSLPKEHRPTPRMIDLSFTFPSGAVLKLAGMEHDKDRMRWHGSQLTFVGWDELCTFSDVQYWYLMSRLRSKSKYPTMVRATMNPDPDSFVFDIISSYYIDLETGFPIEERCGVIRYYIRKDGDLVWGDTEEELKEKYGPGTRPVSFSFIGATIHSNPVVLKNNPQYLADLESLKRVDRDRLLHGSWTAREEASGYFKRDWLIKESRIPSEAMCCRCWDKSASEVCEKEMRPDFTASIKMYKKDGEFYITGEYDIEHNFDPVDNDLFGKFRHRPGKRDLIIQQQAQFDGKDCIILLPQDPGGAGQTEYIESAKKLTNLGFIVKKDPCVSNQSKLQKFLPFSSACENQLVHIVESSFPNKKTLEAFYKELEAFDLTKSVRSSRSRKDDLVDCCSGSFNFLSQEQYIPIVIHNQIDSPTAYSTLKEKIA